MFDKKRFGLADKQYKIVSALVQNNVQFVVIGGKAIQLLGRARVAHDLDILVSCDGNAPVLLADSLNLKGKVYDEVVLRAARCSQRFPIPDEVNPIVDILTPTPQQDFNAIFEASRIHRFRNLSLHYSSPRDLLEMKLASRAELARKLKTCEYGEKERRNGEERLRVDDEDIVFLQKII